MKLKAIKNKASENIKEVADFVKESLSLEAKQLIEEIRVRQKDFDYRKLKLRGSTKHLKSYLETFIIKKYNR